MKDRYENLNLVDFFPYSYATFDDLTSFISEMEEGAEMNISGNCSLYWDGDTLCFEVLYDDIRGYKDNEKLDTRGKSDEEVLEWVIANLEELSEAEDEMFEDGIEDGDIKEVGMGWFADSQ